MDLTRSSQSLRHSRSLDRSLVDFSSPAKRLSLKQAVASRKIMGTRSRKVYTDQLLNSLLKNKTLPFEKFRHTCILTLKQGNFEVFGKIRINDTFEV